MTSFEQPPQLASREKLLSPLERFDQLLSRYDTIATAREWTNGIEVEIKGEEGQTTNTTVSLKKYVEALPQPGANPDYHLSARWKHINGATDMAYQGISRDGLARANLDPSIIADLNDTLEQLDICFTAVEGELGLEKS